jgi:isopenicillin N synthase-like dioxygenase
MSESIDLSLLKGTSEENQAVSATLLKTLKTRGVAKLKNHGLPEELISQLFDYVCDFKRLNLHVLTLL